MIFWGFSPQIIILYLIGNLLGLEKISLWAREVLCSCLWALRYQGMIFMCMYTIHCTLWSLVSVVSCICDLNFAQFWYWRNTTWNMHRDHFTISHLEHAMILINMLSMFLFYVPDLFHALSMKLQWWTCWRSNRSEHFLIIQPCSMQLMIQGFHMTKLQATKQSIHFALSDML